MRRLWWWWFKTNSSEHWLFMSFPFIETWTNFKKNADVKWRTHQSWKAIWPNRVFHFSNSTTFNRVCSTSKGWCFKTLNPSRSTLGVFDLKEHLGIDSLNSPFQTAIKNHQSPVFPSRVGINLPHFFFIGRTSGTIFVSPAIPRKFDSRRYTQKNAQKGTQDFKNIGISFTLILRKTSKPNTSSVLPGLAK